MHVLLYEFVTGGGWFSCDSQAPTSSLLVEGRAMLGALAADFLALGGVTVDVLCDSRLPRLELAGANVHLVKHADDERRTLEHLAAAADWTVLIAPEFDNLLLHRAQWVERAGGRLLSPPSEVIWLAGDKHATAEHLRARGVPAPQGIALSAGDRLPADFAWPAVLKPRDGAGSLGVKLIREFEPIEFDVPSRLEAFCPGIAASVACLCGPREVVPLEPCLQHLSGPGFEYAGGSLPIQPQLAARARQLAKRAVETLPEPRGYVGVDLVLGVDMPGVDAGESRDVVIEINPRLTTSYVGLRALASVNLAGEMIAVAEGRQAELCWKRNTLHFSSSGTCGPQPRAESFS